jgi:hypothetical protein
MAHILAQLFIETTLKRLDEFDERLKEAETKLSNILDYMHIAEMSEQRGYLPLKSASKKRKG